MTSIRSPGTHAIIALVSLGLACSSDAPGGGNGGSSAGYAGGSLPGGAWAMEGPSAQAVSSARGARRAPVARAARAVGAARVARVPAGRPALVARRAPVARAARAAEAARVARVPAGRPALPARRALVARVARAVGAARAVRVPAGRPALVARRSPVAHRELSAVRRWPVRKLDDSGPLLDLDSRNLGLHSCGRKQTDDPGPGRRLAQARGQCIERHVRHSDHRPRFWLRADHTDRIRRGQFPIDPLG